jgi:hypothetical protein
VKVKHHRLVKTATPYTVDGSVKLEVLLTITDLHMPCMVSQGLALG